ncbi:Sec-independent protein translocase protein TatB [Sphingomonas flavalba]|uniref:Sec-independent protein translocase protein TatB n=1 Tax=Sphingomonas flavalba TaxID=2559804 RepID=UPI00109E2C2D|nr:Sec-independent protein translocase protein TatB [Sphingomonas flavalba]
MFDVAPTELIVVAVVALLVIGPKDLPRALHHLGKWMGKMRGMARHFRTGLDTMVREAELAEMEKKWAEDNARIMRDYPDATPAAEPAPPPADAEPAAIAPPPPAAEEGGR